MAVQARFLSASRGLILGAGEALLRKRGGGKQKVAETNEPNEEAFRHFRLNYITGDFVLMNGSPPSGVPP